jgi:hypothetical protein
VRPPTFAEAMNPRQKVRAAGLDPDHWYAAEYLRALPPGGALVTRFWGRTLTLAHAADGQLSAGGCPVQARYGLVWIFPGDPARASQVPLPDVRELEGPDPWAYVAIDFTWYAHHSMIVDSLCDLSEPRLHWRLTSLQPGRLLECEAEDGRVLLRYEARVGPLVRLRVAPSPLSVCYDYPYQWAAFEWSGIRGRIKYWAFLLPLDARTTRVFFVMMYDRLRVAALPISLSHRAVRWLLRAVQPSVRTLLDEDGAVLESKQASYEAQWTSPLVDLNPAVSLLHRLTIRKWEAHQLRAELPATT